MIYNQFQILCLKWNYLCVPVSWADLCWNGHFFILWSCSLSLKVMCIICKFNHIHFMILQEYLLILSMRWLIIEVYILLIFHSHSYRSYLSSLICYHFSLFLLFLFPGCENECCCGLQEILPFFFDSVTLSLTISII